MESARLLAFGAQLLAFLDRLRSMTFGDRAGLPPADPVLERIGRIIAIVATVWMTGVGLWEIAAPFGAGHYAAATAIATGGENMWRFGIVGAAPRFLAEPPAPGDYYCHHPWGTFWTAALFVGLFGHHDWVCRLPAVLMSGAIPLLLYGAGRALWGPLAGALAAAAFAVTPIALAYASFFALEGSVMFSMALATFAYVRFTQTARRRFLWSFVGALGLAVSFDWPGFVFASLVLATLLLRGFFLRRWFPPVHFERFALLWATSVSLCIAVGLFHLIAFVHVDQFKNLIFQGEARARGSSLPLEQVLESRKYWISLAFTPLAIALGKLGAPVLFARAALGRREGELFPLAILATAVLQYLVFKQGADIHFFWPQYFALYFAFALGALAATAHDAVRYTLGRLARERWLRPASFAVLGAGLTVVLMILPDGLRALRWARKSGGRFNEKGLLIHPDLDKQAVFAHLEHTLPEAAILAVDGSMKHSYWMDWTLERVVNISPLPPPRARAFGSHYALDTRFTSGAAARSLAENHAVTAFGPYLVADLLAEPEPLLGFSTPRREPSALERWFVSSSHALYAVVPDPFWTWELREHFQQAPNPPPRTPARNASEMRAAHNLAVLEGNAELAARLELELLSGADRRVARTFTQGVSLLGARFERGASDILTVYFKAAGPLRSDHRFVITARVERAPRGSLVPPDAPAEVGMPFAIASSLWRPGFIYESVTDVLGKPGRVHYSGAFGGADPPRPSAGSGEVALIVLE